MLLILAAFLSAGSGPDLAAYPRVDTPFGPQVVIDGARHPEAIPDWLVWAQTLRHVGRAPEFPADILGLAGPDAAALRDAASGQTERDASCQARLDAYMGAAPAQVRAVHVGCRGENLAAAKAALAALSPEGRATLVRWLDAMRAGTRAYVHVDNADFFALPRLK